MRCDANGSIESAIGTAANVHFALAHPAVTLGAVFAISAPVGTHPYKVAGRYYEDDILAEPMVVKDGGILLLDAPGHVLDDMLDGLVSRDHAEAAYGVVITADGLVDGPATTILRAQRKG
jgi:L-alanine-DL-glutamate epimerase-like enolase superfamily enzyme